MPGLLRRYASALVGVLLMCPMLVDSPALARTILFVGNSFTFGANSPVMRYHPERVVDLNREGIGGVPALFKTFADEAGLDWTVSLETSPGKDLAWHLANRREVIDRPWDVVILQGYSTLDAERPGDPTRHIAAARTLADLFHGRNPQAQVDLVATWSRADQTFRRALVTGITSRSLRWPTISSPSAVGRLPMARSFMQLCPVGTGLETAPCADGLADPNPL